MTELPAGYIAVDTANIMIGSYLKSIASEPSSLKSLIMDADLLRHYLSNPDISKVKVMFAHTLDYINSGNEGQDAGYNCDALTIVMAGYNEKGDYVFAPGKMVPDHSVPCPRNCPEFGTAANNLLQ